jgi:hypothetical protein
MALLAHHFASFPELPDLPSFRWPGRLPFGVANFGLDFFLRLMRAISIADNYIRQDRLQAYDP